MEDLKFLSKNSIQLCCGNQGCPVISLEKNDIIKIKDDFGNEVTLKPEQAQLIERALRQLI